MNVLAIDPGTRHSAFVLFNGERVIEHGLIENRELLIRLRERDFGGPDMYVTVIEQIESFGLSVGRSTFETVFWSGRFAQAAKTFARVKRSRIKMHLCQSRSAKDADIRRALIRRFGGEAAIERFGILHGMTSHRWSALAVAVTWIDIQHGAWCAQRKDEHAAVV